MSIIGGVLITFFINVVGGVLFGGMFIPSKEPPREEQSITHEKLEEMTLDDPTPREAQQIEAPSADNR